MYLSSIYPSIYPSIHLSICLWLWFSPRDDFAPRGHMTMSGDFPGCQHGGGRGSSWHLVGGDQGSCSTSHRAQDAPHQTVLQPQMSVVLRLRNPGSFYRFETRDPGHEASGPAKAAGHPPLSSAALRGLTMPRCLG